jgi:hypothetical protein
VSLDGINTSKKADIIRGISIFLANMNSGSLNSPSIPRHINETAVKNPPTTKKTTNNIPNLSIKSNK